jgi:hypothetical protein
MRVQGPIQSPDATKPATATLMNTNAYIRILALRV